MKVSDLDHLTDPAELIGPIAMMLSGAPHSETADLLADLILRDRAREERLTALEQTVAKSPIGQARR